MPSSSKESDFFSSPPPQSSSLFGSHVSFLPPSILKIGMHKEIQSKAGAPLLPICQQVKEKVKPAYNKTRVEVPRCFGVRKGSEMQCESEIVPSEQESKN